MADTKLSALASAGTLDGTEEVYTNDAGTSKKTTAAEIKTWSSTAPSFTGIETHAGTNVYTAAAMGALAIDVTKALNTKSISADSTFTFSGTPANSNQWFGMLVTNTDTSSHVLTIPSSFSVNRNAAITTVTVPLSSKLYLQWQYDGSVYNLYGDPVATTGTGNFVQATSPTLVTPVLGVAAATSVNKWVFTAPTTAATLTAGGDSLTYTLPAITCNLGFREIPQNSQSAAYTTVATDNGKHIYHPGADTTARIWTIDSNANVPYPVGTCITFINDTSGGVITIAITSDTLVLAGAGTTGSRTLAANGIATATKITSTRWIINGTGLS